MHVMSTPLKDFFESHPEVPSCFPNLILVVVPATDTRIAGENSNLSKFLRCLHELSLVDHCRPNVVAVLSFCCSVSWRKVEVWKEKMEEKKKSCPGCHIRCFKGLCTCCFVGE